jgi:hypothetical protein
MSVNSTTFVSAWQKAKSPGDVAKRLGMSLSAVQRQSVRLRSLGVKLKYFRAPTNVEELNKLCR